MRALKDGRRLADGCAEGSAPGWVRAPQAGVGGWHPGVCGR